MWLRDGESAYHVSPWYEEVEEETVAQRTALVAGHQVTLQKIRRRVWYRHREDHSKDYTRGCSETTLFIVDGLPHRLTISEDGYACFRTEAPEAATVAKALGGRETAPGAWKLKI